MSEGLTDTAMLHQRQAERMFAGAVWMDEDYARQVCGWLKPDMFLDERLGKYWGLVKDGARANDAAVSVQAYMDVLDCVTLIATGRDAPAFADAIALDVYLREASQGAGEIARAIIDRNVTKVKEIAGKIVSGSPVSGDELITSVEVGMEFVATLNDIGGRTETTGLRSLDYAMGGFEQETLTMIGGRPGMGKTAFGLQICTENARAGRRPMIFSLEMSRKNLWARLACGRARVSWRDIKAKRATPEQLERVEQCSADLIDEFEDRFIIDDTASVTTNYIWRRVAAVQPDIVVIDHLALVNSSDRNSNNEVIRLGDISRNGKMLSRAFHIPVVYLVQLNRGVEQRDDKRPQLSDLRASGELEQDADNVLFLYRHDYYAKDADPTKEKVEAEINGAKIRDGNSSFQVKAMYDLVEQHFYPIIKEQKR